MKRSLHKRILAVLMVAVMVLSLFSTTVLAAEKTHDPHETSQAQDGEGYIVGIRQTYPATQANSANSQWISELEPLSEEAGLYLVDSLAQVEKIPQQYVAFVEPDYPLYLLDGTNDELYVKGIQWDVDNMNVPAAWSKGQYGAGATVAVIDSGLYGVNEGESHQDVDPNKIVDPYNFLSNSTLVTDEKGHGTFVAGQIFATANNGVGIAGTMPAVKIMPLKVFGTGDAATSDVIRAIEYAVAHGADVINMSLGGEEKSQALENACQAAVDAGVLVVAAAGNDGTSDPCYPAAYSCVVGVGAVTSENLLYKNSQYGEGVYVVAPGAGIAGLSNTADGYCYKSGTSMASPGVAALGAMAKSINKDMSQSAFMTLLQETCTDLGETGRDGLYGYGLVNFGKAADRLLGTEDHTYGPWVSNGLSTHSRTCTDTDCTAKETALHTWDAGAAAEDGSLTYTCTVCGQTRTSQNPIRDVWEYELTDNGTAVKLTKYIGTHTTVIVPSTLEVDGKVLPVTGIGNSTFQGSSIFWLELPDSITYVDDGTQSPSAGVTGACAFCQELTVVKLSAGMEKVADYMFYGAGSDYRMELTVPQGVREIGVSAFSMCNSLVNLKLPESVTRIDNSAFYQARRLATMEMPGVTTVEADAFTETIFEETYENLWKAGEFTGIVYAGNVAYLYFGPYVPGESGEYDPSRMPSDTELVLKDGTLGISEFLFSSHYVDAASCKANLKSITVPMTLAHIPDQFLDGYGTVDLYGFSGSYAETWAGRYDNVRFHSMELPAAPEYDYDWYDNTTGNVYEIGTAGALWGLADLTDIGEDTFAGKTIRLTADIDLGGLTVGGYANAANKWYPLSGFAGTLDGQGHTISGVYVDMTGRDNAGFFSSLPKGAEVRNLTVEGRITGGDKVGGIAGTSAGATIDSCTFDGTIIGGKGSNGLGYVGGIVGYATGKITGCKTAGSVTVSLDYVSDTLLNGATGGIAGYVTSMASVENCQNEAEVSSNGISTGGIVGQMMMLSAVKSCENRGSVAGYKQVGGIAGRIVNGARADTVLGCTNSGSVTATEEDCGGIAGITSGGSMYINDCINTGAVQTRINAGGILGHNSGVTVQRSYNTGSVTAAMSHAGGIIGKDSATGTANCYNLGQITAKYYAGGICAYMDNAHATEGAMVNCYNMGLVQATAGVGAPLASVYQDANVFTNCYYLSDAEDTTVPNHTGKPQAAFTGGEVAYLLGDAYGQLLGVEDADAHPVFRTDSNQVFTDGTSYYNAGNEPHTHSYTGTVTAPTCTERGYTTYTCTCGDSYVDDYVDALGHAYNEFCEDNGDGTHYWECDRCDGWGDKEPHIFESGYCTACGAKEPAHTHSYGTWVSDGADTHTHACSCGQTETQAHTWDEGQITREPTASEEGIRTYTCTLCGETKTESIPPVQGETLTISTLAELQDFAEAVDGGTSYDGKTILLTQDIDASGVTWNPIGSYTSTSSFVAFDGIFDGQGHIVTLNAQDATAAGYGFFAVNAGTVRDLTVDGVVSGKSYVGAIAGRNSGVITGCVNRAEVSATSMAVGGITAYMNNKAVVENCANEAAVTGNGTTYTGGIVAQALSGTRVSSSCNLGAVTSAKTYTGGVVGYAMGCAVDSCYNAGAVTSTSSTGKTVGGVAGMFTGTTFLENCYNVGLVTFGGDSGAVAGTLVTTQNKNNFYLADTGTYGVASTKWVDGMKQAEEMKTADFAAALGSAYKFCDGSYPLLTWQKETTPACQHSTTKTHYRSNGDQASHTVKTLCADCGEVLSEQSLLCPSSFVVNLPATCTEPGYTYAFQCPDCKQILLGSVVDPNAPALGHNYVDGVCTRCGDGGEPLPEVCPHTKTQLENVRDATCTEAGYTGDRVCLQCGVTVKSGTVIKALGHLENPNRCVDNGDGTHNWACWRCNEVFSNEPHHFVEGVCTVCLARQPGACEQHIWDNGTVTKQPTENQPGEMTFTCTVCGITRTESINPLLFSYEITDGKATILKWYGTVPQANIPDEVEGCPITALGQNCFAWNETLTTVTGGKNLETIGKGAFYYCQSLTSCEILDGITTIGEDAFCFCDALTALTIPNSVVTIGEEAFGYCDGLQAVTIGSGVTAIGEGAFYRCSALTEIQVHTANKSYASIDGVLFNLEKTELLQYPCGKQDSAYTVPDGVGAIHEAAFAWVENLTSVTLPSSVRTLGKNAFAYAKSLTAVTLCEGLEAIGEAAFDHCAALGNVAFPSTLTGIGDSAFYACTALREISIPDQVSSIGGHAFQRCTGLRSVNIGAGVENIGAGAFGDNENLETFRVTSKHDIEWNGKGIFDIALENLTVYAYCGTTLQAYAQLSTTNFVALGDHTFGSWTRTIEPTCTEAGLEERVCSICGERETRPIAPMGHTEVTDPAVAPTCTESGLTEGKHCSVCGEILTEQTVLPATGHSFESVVTAPACESIGYTTHTCTACGSSYMDTIVPATGHSYEDAVTAPTCQRDGYTTHTCTACGSSYVDAFVPATGHSYEDVVTAPTCDEMGYTTHTCTECGFRYVDSYVQATDHHYEKAVTKEPTCTNEGEMTFTCMDCHRTYTEAIAKLAHTYEATQTAPTCESMGYTTYTCTACGDSYRADFVDATGHDLETCTVDATCLSYGYTKNTCKHCDFAYISQITEPLGHKLELQGQKEASLDADGYTGDYVCTVCGLVAEKGEAIPALGHKCAAYTDIPDGWAKSGICFVIENNLMNGTSQTTFSPKVTMNRAMLVTVLYRLAGAPEVSGICRFQDVTAGTYYEKAVIWAAEHGIVYGVSDDRFAPEAPVTREQMVTFLYRYAKNCGADVSASADLTGFTDAGQIAAYAKAPMAWAVANQIVNGTSETTLSPKASAAREQIAAILMRFVKATKA